MSAAPESGEIEVVIDIKPVAQKHELTVVRQKIAVKDGKLVRVGGQTHEWVKIWAIGTAGE